MTNPTTKNPNPTFRELIDICYAVKCQKCDHKIIEPDKTKNQEIYKGECPHCGHTPKNKKQKQKSKHQEMQERQQINAVYRAQYEAANENEGFVFYDKRLMS